MSLGSNFQKMVELYAKDYLKSQEEHVCEGFSYLQGFVNKKRYYVVLTPSRLYLMRLSGMGTIKDHRELPLSEIRSWQVKKGAPISLFGIIFWIFVWPITRLTTRRLILELVPGETIVPVFNVKRYRQVPEQICQYLSSVTG